MLTTKAPNLLKTITLCFFLFGWAHTNICSAESLINSYRVNRDKILNKLLADRNNLTVIDFKPYLLASDIETRTQFTLLMALCANEPKKALAAVHAYAICKSMHENALRLQRTLKIAILNKNLQLQRPLSVIERIGKHYRQNSNDPRRELRLLFGMEEGEIVWEITQPDGTLTSFRDAMSVVDFDHAGQWFMKDLALDYLENSPQSFIPAVPKLGEPSVPSVPELPLNPPTAMPKPYNSSAPAQAEPSEYK